MYGIIYSFLLILVIVYKSHFCKNESASSEGNVPENIRLTDDRKDPSGWKRYQTCFMSKRKLLEVLEMKDFVKNALIDLQKGISIIYILIIAPFIYDNSK